MNVWLFPTISYVKIWFILQFITNHLFNFPLYWLLKNGIPIIWTNKPYHKEWFFTPKTNLNRVFSHKFARPSGTPNFLPTRGTSLETKIQPQEVQGSGRGPDESVLVGNNYHPRWWKIRDQTSSKISTIPKGSRNFTGTQKGHIFSQKLPGRLQAKRNPFGSKMIDQRNPIYRYKKTCGE